MYLWGQKLEKFCLAYQEHLRSCYDLSMWSQRSIKESEPESFLVWLFNVPGESTMLNSTRKSERIAPPSPTPLPRLVHPGPRRLPSGWISLAGVTPERFPNPSSFCVALPCSCWGYDHLPEASASRPAPLHPRMYPDELSESVSE